MKHTDSPAAATLSPASISPDSISVIANPTSGKALVRNTWVELQRRITERLGQGIAFHLTEAPAHATELAATSVAAGRTSVISIGGDGTHSEVACGLLLAKQESSTSANDTTVVSQACIHAGTGGDFRRTLGLRREADVLHAIATLTPKPMDVGEVHYTSYEGESRRRYFINIASMGVAGLVDRYVGEAKTSNSRLGGPFAYLSATLRAMREYQPARGEIFIDGQSVGEQSIQNLCVCNGRFFGSGMKIAPNAELDDGLFDIVIVKHAPLLRSALLAPGLYRGTHTNSSLVEVHRGTSVEFRPTNDAAAHMDIDGENLGQSPASFKIIPNAINIWRA